MSLIQEVRDIEEINSVGRAEHVCRKIEEIVGTDLYDQRGQLLRLTVDDLRYVAEQLREYGVV